jgi:hypothetical protein
MPKKRPPAQRTLALQLNSPLSLTSDEQSELAQALAQLLLAIANEENKQVAQLTQKGGQDDDEDHA